MTEQHKKLYRQAFALALITIFYNIAEGLVSTWLGFEDETIALFGFGIDSFIETISGIGVAHMILRIRNNPNTPRDKFEITALKVTGWSFYLLTGGLIISAAYNIYSGQKPETTFWGIVISAISIFTMWALIWAKMRVGRALDSKPIIADAGCTRVCLYMSIILLVSSLAYEFTGFPYIDAVGAIALAWFSFKEGRECFEKAENISTCGCGGSCH
jgi:divalent metal cation (Fe/Co/Zn/Cd) transporter